MVEHATLYYQHLSRELSEDYSHSKDSRARLAVAVHEPASALIKTLWTEWKRLYKKREAVKRRARQAMQRARRLGKLADLAFHSLNLHIVEKGAAEATDEPTRRRYERQAEEIKREMRAISEREAPGIKRAAKAAKAGKGSGTSRLSMSAAAYSGRRSRLTIGSARKMAGKGSARKRLQRRSNRKLRSKSIKHLN